MPSDAAGGPSEPGRPRGARSGRGRALVALSLAGVLGAAAVTAAWAWGLPGGADPGVTDPADAAGEAGAGGAGAGAVAPGAVKPSVGASTVPGSRADPEWLDRTARATGIPERALTAYAQAALWAEEATPGCGIGWNTVAAIGLVESGHGSIGGAVLGADGRALPKITGPALDGTVYDAITDTDAGALDGDTVWDRAVGPMQFLPTTWAHYGRDATGDGVADPNQIDDAAWATATMLCAEGGDLTVPENWITAVDAYNPNIGYNHDVADAAEVYAAAVPN